VLDPDVIEANARTFQEQAHAVLDPDPSRLEVRFNSEWLDMPMDQLFRLARTTTVAQLLERQDFSERFTAREPISVLELLYPLLQGYDSVAVKADVELGGTDQKFNLLLGRDIQRAYGEGEQAILTMPILVGTDGVRRMSKSLGNYVGVTDPPNDLYGKTMSIPDSSLGDWYRLLLGSDPPPGDAFRAKLALARALVARFYDDAAAQAAEQAFAQVHRRGELPDDVPAVGWTRDEGQVHVPALLSRAFGVSTSEARRAIAQGGVRLDGDPVSNGALDLPAEEVDGKVLQLGKRRFARVRVT
jgi:tyrosyl-tRNA synthetase